MSKSSEIRSRLKSLKKEYQQAAQSEFKEQLAALFESHPRLKSFSWTQYTPHFNDGDTCSFSAHIDEPKINGFDPYDGEDAEGDHGAENLHALGETEIYEGGKYVPNPKRDKEAAKAVKAVTEFLKTFEEDIYLEMFGDHVEVTATKKGVSASEYSHD